MFSFLTALLSPVFKIIYSNHKDLIFTLMLLKKENQIFKRQMNLQKVQFTMKRKDRLLLSYIFKLSTSLINPWCSFSPSESEIKKLLHIKIFQSASELLSFLKCYLHHNFCQNSVLKPTD